MGASTGRRRLVTADPHSVDDTGCGILHADMDAFFAAVELRRRPELRGLPMLVGSTRGRGVVLSATYEARSRGIRSAMPVSRALAAAPETVVVEPDIAAYRAASAEVMSVFRNITPHVEQVSVDEAFLDVSGLRRIAGRPAAIAVNLRRRVQNELGLGCTIGVAATKFMAKLASTLAKPDGLLVVPVADQIPLLHGLDLDALWGVGPRTAEQLRRVGLRTIGDLAQLDAATLTGLVGSAAAAKLHDLAWARDPREVSARAPEASMSADETFAADVTDRSQLERELLRLSDRLARRLRAAHQRGRTVAIRVRYEDFTTVTRSTTLPAATDVTRTIHRTAVDLLTTLNPARPVRLIGVRVEQLADDGTAEEQLTFDAVAAPPWRDAETVADRVSARFPAGALAPASLLAGRGRQVPVGGHSTESERPVGPRRVPRERSDDRSARLPDGSTGR